MFFFLPAQRVCNDCGIRRLMIICSIAFLSYFQHQFCILLLTIYLYNVHRSLLLISVMISLIGVGDPQWKHAASLMQKVWFNREC